MNELGKLEKEMNETRKGAYLVYRFLYYSTIGPESRETASEASSSGMSKQEIYNLIKESICVD